ncbi:NYN domain-containing protein, partial [Candidatus Uhrbacteria bacterium]|nr:NYN domain-containing protein [Candidatus Uhrbacteria bacterium]
RGEGEVDAEYIYDSVRIDQIQPGDEILSLDEQTGRFEYQKVKALMDMGTKPIYKLTTASGKTIRTTGNHPYLVRVGTDDIMKISEPSQEGHVGLTNLNLAEVAEVKENGAFTRSITSLRDRADAGSILNSAISALQKGASFGGDKQGFSHVPRIAVFIDAANLEKSVEKIGFKVHYKNLKRLFTALGQLNYIGYFTVATDAPHNRDLRASLLRFGYSLVTKPLKLIKDKRGLMRKADVDVEITSEALERKEDFDVMILFSGDSDFYYPIQLLQKRYGKKVIVISTKYSIFKELLKVADRYIDIYKLKSSIARGIQKSPSFSTGGSPFGESSLSTAGKDSILNGQDLSSGEPAWVKAALLTVGDEIAVRNNSPQPSLTLREGVSPLHGRGDEGELLFEKITAIEKLRPEQVYDIEVEGTHNFVGNDIVAHNTYLQGSATTTGVHHISEYLNVTGSATSTISSGLTVDSNTLVINANENRVGIGTASPTTTLGVVGATRLNGALFAAGAVTLDNLISCDTIDTSSAGLLSCGTDANTLGQNGAWQEVAANVLAPTNTAAAILVNSATSTITVLHADTINASTTVATTFNLNSENFTDLTGTGLQNTAGVLNVNYAQVAPAGTNASWQSLFADTALTPTNTSAGIFVRASSTFDSTLRVNNNLSVIKASDNAFLVNTATGDDATTTVTGYFRVASSTASLDTPVLWADGATGRVGINTNAPTTTFGVVGASRFNGTLFAAGAVTLDNLSSAGTRCVEASSVGLLSVAGAACGTGAPGQNGAWETLFTNALTPTSTTAGIFVRASSTFDSTLRVNGALSVTTPSASSTIAHSLIVDTDTLVVNANEGRVGIGTAGPLRALHVRAAGALQIDANANDGLEIVQTATNQWGWRNVGTGATTLFAFYSPLLSLDIASSRVGIGTTAPATKLEVVGTASTSALTVGGAGLTSTTTNVYGGAIFDVDSNTLVVNANENRVGVGTAFPTTTLGVLGATRFNGALTATGPITLDNLSSAGTQCVQASSAGLLSVTGAACTVAGSSGAWETLFTNALTPTSSSAGIFVRASSTFDSTLRINSDFTVVHPFNQTNALFVDTSTTADDATTSIAGYFRVGTSTAALSTGNPALFVDGVTGNVGIGTTGPGAKLDVNGNIQITSASGRYDLAAAGVTNWFWKYNGNDTIFGVNSGSDRSLTFDNEGAGNLNMIVQGNLGIATTTPGGTFGEKLTVVGSTFFDPGATTNRGLIIEPRSGATANLLEFTANSTHSFLSGFTAAGGLLMNISSTTAIAVQKSGDNAFVVNTGAGDDATTTVTGYFRIASSTASIDTPVLWADGATGRVGINISAPSTTLGVVGATRFNGTLFAAGQVTLDNLAGATTRCVEATAAGLLQTAADACGSGGGGSPGAWQSIFADTALTPTNTSAGIFVRASSTFDSTLKINSDFTVVHPFNQTNALFVDTSTTADDATTTVTGYFRVATSTSALTGGSPALFVDGVSGNVGIGTAGPGYALDVVGTINASAAVRIGGNPTLLNNGQFSSIYSGSTSFRVLNNAGSETVATFLTSGSVGIATTTPGGTFGEKFTVVGGTFITGSTTIAAFSGGVPNNTLVVNTNESRVGVGTATPSTTLGVVGATRFNGTLFAAGAVTLDNLISCDTIDTSSTGLLSCGTDANTLGQNGAWQEVAANVLSPTNTAAAILVNSATSTITVLHSDTVNASTTVATTFNLNSENFTDLTGTGLQNTAGVLNVNYAQVAPAGINGAWQSVFADTALTPTNTSAGIFVRASSTIDSTLRVNNNLSVIKASDNAFLVNTGTGDDATTTITGYFRVASSTASLDTPVLWADGATGRVGINSSAPSTTLGVVGASRFIGSLFASGQVTLDNLAGASTRCVEATSAGLLQAAGSACAAAGQNGAWQEVAANVLSPTNTAAAILVNSATSTITVLHADTVNASTTVATTFNLNSENFTDLTGTGLQNTAGVLNVNYAQVAPAGINGAWQSVFADTALTPTNTSAGIFVRASSTIDSTLRINNNLSVIKASDNAFLVNTGAGDDATTTVTGYFRVASSTASLDTPVLWADGASGRVGINTSAPTTTFGVVGASRFIGTLFAAGQVTLDNLIS